MVVRLTRSIRPKRLPWLLCAAVLVLPISSLAAEEEAKSASDVVQEAVAPKEMSGDEQSSSDAKGMVEGLTEAVRGAASDAAALADDVVNKVAASTNADGDGKAKPAAAGDKPPAEPAAVEEAKSAPAPEPDPVPAPAPAPKPAPLASKYKDPFPPDILRIKERGKLVVAQFHGERKGFFMYDEGNEFPDANAYTDSEGRRVVGHDIEIASKIAKRLGVELEVRRDIKSFNDITRAVSRGEADIGASKITITMSRGQYVRFSEAYINLRIGVLINRLRELEEKREGDVFEVLNQPGALIAVQRGTSWVAIGKDLFPQATLVEYPNMNAALEAVTRGETLGFLNDEWNLTVKLNDKPETTLRARLAFIPDRLSGIAVAVSPDAPNLLSFVNLMVERDNIKTTPEALVRRYFKAEARSMATRVSDATGNEAIQGTPFIALATLAGASLLLLLMWLRLSMTPRRAKG